MENLLQMPKIQRARKNLYPLVKAGYGQHTLKKAEKACFVHPIQYSFYVSIYSRLFSGQSSSRFCPRFRLRPARLQPWLRTTRSVWRPYGSKLRPIVGSYASFADWWWCQWKQQHCQTGQAQPLLRIQKNFKLRSFGTC